MKHSATFLALLALILCGCAGGPAHDYYKPVVVDAKFKGPVTTELVENLLMAKEKCVREGYTVIGTAAYAGNYPESNGLVTKAESVGANHVIYSVKNIPGAPGNWSLGFNNSGIASGGTGVGANEVNIVFLGK